MEEINLVEVYNYYKTKVVWIVITLILIVTIGNVYTILTRVPIYQSNTTIVLVGEGNEYNQSDSQLNQNLIGTYSEIIKSRKVLSQVVENLNLTETTYELSNNISAASIDDTEIIKITVKDEDPQKAKKIANEVARVFAREIKDIYNLENVSIIDKAVAAKNPSNINYVKDNLIYLAIGLVLSFGSIFIMFYFDTTIKSSEEIEEKLGLSVIGIVPKEEEE